jgi:hypothetical protein
MRTTESLRIAAFATVLLLLAATAAAHFRQEVYTEDDMRNRWMDQHGVGGPEGAAKRRHQDVVDRCLPSFIFHLLTEGYMNIYSILN